jgi:hypothetical protein
MTPFWVGVSVGGVGGALAVLFAVFKGEANSNYTATHNSIDAAYKKQIAPTKPPQGFCRSPPSNFNQACQNVQSDANQINSDATAANVAVVVGIAGLAFSAVYFLAANKGDSKPTPPASSLVPVLEPHYQGMSYTLSF